MPLDVNFVAGLIKSTMISVYAAQTQSHNPQVIEGEDSQVTDVASPGVLEPALVEAVAQGVATGIITALKSGIVPVTVATPTGPGSGTGIGVF